MDLPKPIDTMVGDFLFNSCDQLVFQQWLHPQIGSSQAKETLYHPERDVDFIAPHYLSPENMKEFEQNATKPLIQTEFAHACGNGFNDFEDRYRRMKERPDLWMGPSSVSPESSSAPTRSRCSTGARRVA